MKQTIELEQLCYYLVNKESRDENKILLVKEQSDEGVKWIPLSKGWEYQLWYSFGERGGLAEAEELLVLQNAKVTTLTIEEYIKRSRQILKDSIPAEHLLERFKVHVTAWRDVDVEYKFIIPFKNGVY